MDEDVLAVGLGDESVALLCIEEFHGAGGHVSISFSLALRLRLRCCGVAVPGSVTWRGSAGPLLGRSAALAPGAAAGLAVAADLGVPGAPRPPDPLLARPLRRAPPGRPGAGAAGGRACSVVVTVAVDGPSGASRPWLRPRARCMPRTVRVVLLGDQGDHRPGLTGPARSPGAVQVVGGIGRGVEVHDARQVVDVDAPGGHVGGDQRVARPLVNAARARSRCAWVRSPWMATALTPAAPSWRATRSAPRLVRQKTTAWPCWVTRRGGEIDPLGPLGPPEDVGDLAHARLVGHHVVADRVALVGGDDRLDLSADGGREEQDLAVRCGLVEQPAHRGQEPHVGHPVGLVEHDGPDVAQAAARPGPAGPPAGPGRPPPRPPRGSSARRLAP